VVLPFSGEQLWERVQENEGRAGGRRSDGGAVPAGGAWEAAGAAGGGEGRPVPSVSAAEDRGGEGSAKTRTLLVPTVGDRVLENGGGAAVVAVESLWRCDAGGRDTSMWLA